MMLDMPGLVRQDRHNLIVVPGQLYERICRDQRA